MVEAVRATHIVCGFLASEEAYNPLIATLRDC